MLALSLIAAGFVARSQAVWLGGVNMAGCDIGMDTSGNYRPEDSYNGEYKCPSLDMATSQMQHFANKDGFNVFRLPVPWQSLVNNDLVNNVLDQSFMQEYNALLQACLDTGAHCIIDIHNYARWWGGIVGQDGPSAEDLAQTWSQLASTWASQPRIIFGTMNEPHDTAGTNDFDVDTWANTLQTVVYAIRDAGATSQIILLSPTNYADAISFPNYATALEKVVNRDGSTTNLIFELHQYFDSKGGTTSGCNDVLAAKFETVGNFLRSIGRQAFMGELGGGNGQDCIDIICPVLDVLNNYGDVFIGWSSWAAGNWWPSYELSEVPNGDQDVGIVASCFAPKFAAAKS